MNNTDHDLKPETVENLAQQVQSGKLKGEFMTLAEKFEERGEARGQTFVFASYFSKRFDEGSLDDWNKQLANLTPKMREELAESFWKFESAGEVRQWIAEKREANS